MEQLSRVSYIVLHALTHTAYIPHANKVQQLVINGHIEHVVYT